MTYWIEHSANLSIEAMMLDSKASDLDKEERLEVLSLLPAIEGISVLELGAGIGRKHNIVLSQVVEDLCPDLLCYF